MEVVAAELTLQHAAAESLLADAVAGLLAVRLPLLDVGGAVGADHVQLPALRRLVEAGGNVRLGCGDSEMNMNKWVR